MTTSVEDQARDTVAKMFESGGSPEVTSLLRRRVQDRVDPLSKAIERELDRVCREQEVAAAAGLDWSGWER